MARQYTETTQKILLLLLGGLVLGFSRSPRGYFKNFNAIQKEWQRINKNLLWKSIRQLYENQLVQFKEEKNGLITVLLTKKGKKIAVSYNLDNMQITIPAVWDKKWRIVMFDIPEKYKKARDALRWHLKQLGFIQLQKSVFCFPYDCKKEIDLIIDLYQIRRWVRYLTSDFIDNELHLRTKFGL